jgi:hypothetical protein
MATIVKKEGIASVVIRNQPVERPQHVVRGRNITGVILVVGKDDHATKN